MNNPGPITIFELAEKCGCGKTLDRHFTPILYKGDVDLSSCAHKNPLCLIDRPFYWALQRDDINTFRNILDHGVSPLEMCQGRYDCPHNDMRLDCDCSSTLLDYTMKYYQGIKDLDEDSVLPVNILQHLVEVELEPRPDHLKLIVEFSCFSSIRITLDDVWSAIRAEYHHPNTGPEFIPSITALFERAIQDIRDKLESIPKCLEILEDLFAMHENYRKPHLNDLIELLVTYIVELEPKSLNLIVKNRCFSTTQVPLDAVFKIIHGEYLDSDTNPEFVPSITALFKCAIRDISKPLNFTPEFLFQSLEDLFRLHPNYHKPGLDAFIELFITFFVDLEPKNLNLIVQANGLSIAPITLDIVREVIHAEYCHPNTNPEFITSITAFIPDWLKCIPKYVVEILNDLFELPPQHRKHHLNDLTKLLFDYLNIKSNPERINLIVKTKGFSTAQITLVILQEAISAEYDHPSTTNPKFITSISGLLKRAIQSNIHQPFESLPAALATILQELLKKPKVRRKSHLSDLVKLLLVHGAPVFQRDQDGYTFLDRAIAEYHILDIVDTPRNGKAYPFGAVRKGSSATQQSPSGGGRMAHRVSELMGNWLFQGLRQNLLPEIMRLNNVVFTELADEDESDDDSESDDEAMDDWETGSDDDTMEDEETGREQDEAMGDGETRRGHDTDGAMEGGEARSRDDAIEEKNEAAADDRPQDWEMIEDPEWLDNEEPEDIGKFEEYLNSNESSDFSITANSMPPAPAHDAMKPIF
ncbi:Protein of unknown function [Pyronema omphalodes CBS 100304]|uniref:Uncharacterized protein n=1 Tax=Pyronema omphalodes (strain CBS 100304) TaxID=1076935 RepID=U4LF70_PYROM|nr:Protein of unknown function [Pyronema omphalodes CBS 100304]